MNFTGLLKDFTFKLKNNVWNLKKDSSDLQKHSDKLGFHYLTICMYIKSKSPYSANFKTTEWTSLNGFKGLQVTI